MATAVAPNTLPVPEKQGPVRTASVLHLVPELTPSVYSKDEFYSIVTREAAFLIDHRETREGQDTVNQHLGRVSFLKLQLENYGLQPTPHQRVTATAEQLDLHTSILKGAGIEIPADIFA